MNGVETDHDVIIVGCGIGGASTALALAREGLSVRVLERAPEIGEVGAGLQVGPNAMRILRDLGVLDHLSQKVVLPDRAVMRDLRTDEEITSIDFGPFTDRYGAPYAVMHRGDLLTGLIKACVDTGLVTIEPDRHVTAIEEDDQSVTAACANGAAYRAPVLIGADGLRSQVRAHLFGDEPPLASKYVIYRATVPRGDDVENAVTLYAAHNHHIMRYPIRSGEMANIVASFKSERDVPGGAGWGTPEELAEIFSDAGPSVKEAISHLDLSHRWVQFDRDPRPGWSRGRIVLMGDAAHPTHQYLAQGACQAMADAVTLAQLLPGRLNDFAAVFEEFERHRYPIASAVQRGSRFWGEMSHFGGDAAASRDTVLRAIAPDDYRFIDWIYTTRKDVRPPRIPPHQDVYVPYVDQVTA